MSNLSLLEQKYRYVRDSPYPNGTRGLNLYGVELILLDSELVAYAANLLERNRVAEIDRDYLARMFLRSKQVLPGLAGQARSYFAEIHELAALLFGHLIRPNLSTEELRNVEFVLAAINSDFETLDSLLASGVSIDAQPFAGDTALLAACRQGKSDLMRYLLDMNADVKIRDESGRSPLLLAAVGGHTDLVRFLIEHGEELDQTDEFNQTPLLLASYGNHVDTVALLLTYGANIDICANTGASSLTVAAEFGSRQVQEPF